MRIKMRSFKGGSTSQQSHLTGNHTLLVIEYQRNQLGRLVDRIFRGCKLGQAMDHLLAMTQAVATRCFK
ncbi:hypothetical protein Syn8016DRAFT_1001 [Synechococcus sp. WH 8016]|nr:hypothetical protein Syn8016DRAFT_1001 [Synechococcus sp. WH 8016]